MSARVVAGVLASLAGVLAIGVGTALAGERPTRVVVEDFTFTSVDRLEAVGTLATSDRCKGARRMKLVAFEPDGGKRPLDSVMTRQNGKWRMAGALEDDDQQVRVVASQKRVGRKTTCAKDTEDLFPN